MAGDSPESSDKEEKQPSTPAVLAVDAVQPEAAALGRTVHGLSWVLVVVATLLSTFLFGLDNTIAANVQPAIILEFGAVTRLPWVSVAFMAGAGSTTLFWYVLPALPPDHHANPSSPHLLTCYQGVRCMASATSSGCIYARS